MQVFDGQRHTVDALAREIETIYSLKLDTMLVGSLGRSAAYGFLTGNYLGSFEQGDPLRRPDGSARDIDVINFSPEIATTLSPYEIDTQSFASGIVTLERKGVDWVLRSAAKGYEVPLHPAVMEPVEAEIIDGVKIITVPPQTHFNLVGLRGMMRDKDLQNRTKIKHALDDYGGRLLPEELYKPFEDLRQIWTKDHVVRLREYYHALVPSSVRDCLRPLNRLAMKVLWPD